MPKKSEEKEEQKAIVVTRAVPVEDMFNNILDRLDMIFAKLDENSKKLEDIKKLAEE